MNTNTIAVIPTDNLTRSYPFTFEPRRTLYCPVSFNTISEMRGGTDSRTGSGVMNSVKSFFGKKPNKKVSFAVTPPVREAVPPKPTTNNTNKNAGDKIVKILSGKNPPSRKKNTRQSPKMTQQEINNRVLQIMSGGNALRTGGKII